MPPLLTRNKGLPHEQTKLQIPYHHIEDLRETIKSQLERNTSAVLVIKNDPRIDFTKLLEDRANLPLIVMTIKHPRERIGYSVDRVLDWKNIEGTMLFDPKFEGVATATDPGYLVDSAPDYMDFLRKVRPGDFVAKVEDQGNTVDILEKTVAVSVEPGRIELEDDIFETGDAYEIHWPIDTAMRFNTSRNMDVELDVYADPDAFRDSKPTIELIEREINAWWESDLSRFALIVHGAQRRDSYKATDLSDIQKAVGGSGGTGTKKFYLERVLIEVPLMMGEVVLQPWPSTESIRITDRVFDGVGDALMETTNLVTEDDQRVEVE